MPQLVIKITVFVASPGDVMAERNVAQEVIDHVNNAELLGSNVVVQLKRWETHAWPGFGDDAQAVINRQIGPYDVFVGLMWNRIGTPTGRAVSGTVEEFDRAYEAWKEHKRPALMFYFRQQPADLASRVDPYQRSAVVLFKQRLQNLGALYWEYLGAEDFRRLFSGHLIKELRTQLENQGIGMAGSPRPGPERVRVARLPSIDPVLIGRERYLKLLDDAWSNDKIRVVSIVAFGGVGKTSLAVNWWHQNGAPGAERVFGWSFDSQGSAESRQVSADLFLDETLRDWFDVADPPHSSWQRGEYLAERIREKRTLLILDGMESLQLPPGPQYGRFKDSGMVALLKELAAHSRGLCICTSRFPLPDIEDYGSTSLLKIDLENLSPDAGAKYLSSLGVKGVEDEMKRASEEFDNHALALTLLGSYLVKRLHGDVRKRDTIPNLFMDRKNGGHARRILRQYEGLFANTPKLRILRILGLFDRPVDVKALRILRQAPAIQGLTDRLVDLSEDDWASVLENLGEARLLQYPDVDGPLDCHALVREHFAEEFRTAEPAAFLSAHNRLFEHYTANGPSLPNTMEEMIPLFHAVYHGCQAGHRKHALTEIYRARILRGEQYYLPRSIGSFGADLSLLANFFDRPWTKAAPELSPPDQRWLLSLAGISLRSVGRIMEAIEPTKAGAQAALEAQDWLGASRTLLNLSRLFLVSGQVSEAAKTAQQSVDAADQPVNPLARLSSRAALADVLFQQGNRPEAERLFIEAEMIQACHEPERPILYSLQGFWYCDFLLDKKEFEQVRTRAEKNLEWNKHLLLEIALSHLLLGRACLNYSNEAGEHLNEAVSRLQQASQLHYVPRGLLTRAAHFRLVGNFGAAAKDLEDTRVLAVRCGMRIHLCECHIERAELLVAQGRREEARSEYDAARSLADEIGYHRRSAQLQCLGEQLALRAALD